MTGVLHQSLFLIGISGDDKFDIFANLVLVLLALFSIAVALLGALGYGIYRWMLRIFKDEYSEITEGYKNKIAEATRKYRAEDSMRVRIADGYSNWHLYKKFHEEVAPLIKKATGDEISFDEFLRNAIRQTEIALRVYAPEADQREAEGLIGQGKNNLAYYLAWRREGTDCERAKELAEWIQERIDKNPRHKEAWEHTCRFVQAKCGD